MTDPSIDLPLVSVVVRTMGRPELQLALDSIRAQSWPRIEIVLVVANPAFDPGGLADDPRFRIVRPGHRLPRPDAGNAGIAAARGDWIGFLDEDDCYHSQHIETLMQAAASGPALLVYGDLIVHDAEGTSLRSLGYWKRQHALRPIPHLIGSLFSRALFDRFGVRFDPDFDVLEDWDLFIQCGERTDFLHVDSVVARYNGHLGQSGCGLGPNRDDSVVAFGVRQMNTKWGVHYLDLAERADTALHQAQAALDARDWQRAESAARAGLAVDPGHAALLNRLAFCRRQAGDWAGVLSALRRACDTDREAFAMHCETAVLEQRFGFPARAQALLAGLRRNANTDERRLRLQQVEAALATAPA